MQCFYYPGQLGLEEEASYWPLKSSLILSLSFQSSARSCQSSPVFWQILFWQNKVTKLKSALDPSCWRTLVTTSLINDPSCQTSSTLLPSPRGLYHHHHHKWFFLSHFPLLPSMRRFYHHSSHPPQELVPFTQLVKVRRESLFWYFRASDFHGTFTRSSLALNMRRKLLLDP